MKKSRKKREIGKWARFEDDATPPLERAEAALDQLQHLLFFGHYDDWLLMAGLAVGADQALAEASQSDPSVSRSRFDAVMEEFRELTRNFTDADFLESTRAARRENQTLFQPRR